MSDENRLPPLLEWFKTSYPREYYLQDEIGKRAEDIFRNFSAQIPEGQTVPILIGVKTRPEGSKLGIVMNEAGIIFVGAMAKAILDSLAGEFEGLLSSEIGGNLIEKKVKQVVSQHITSSMKKCPRCQSEIRMNAQFCDQCGRKL